MQGEALKTMNAIAYPADFVLDRNQSKGRTYYRRRVREQGKLGKSLSSLKLFWFLAAFGEAAKNRYWVFPYFGASRDFTLP